MSDFYTDPKNADLVDDMYYRFFEEGIANFADRSQWKEVKDPEFQRLFKAYLDAQEELTKYMKMRFSYKEK